MMLLLPRPSGWVFVCVPFLASAWLVGCDGGPRTDAGHHARAAGHLRPGAHDSAYLQIVARRFTESQPLRQLFPATQVGLGPVGAAAARIPAIGMDAAALLPTLVPMVYGAGLAERGARLPSGSTKARAEDAYRPITVAVDSTRPGDEAGSTESIERTLKLNPDLPEADVMAVIGHMRNGDAEAAFAAARGLIEKHPDLAIGETLLGTVHVWRGQLEEAKRAFRRALEISPDDPDAANNLGIILYGQQRWEEALGPLEIVAAKRPGDLGTLFKLAVVESRLGRDPAALEWLEQAVATNPDDAVPRAALGNAYLAAGNPKKSLDIISEFSQSHELTPALRDVMGRAQLALNQYGPAADTLGPLAELRADDAQLHRQLAQAYEGAGQIENALASAERALELDPAHAPTRFQQARLLAAAGRLDEAQGVIDELEVAHPESVDLRNLEGAIAMRALRFDAAVEAYRRAFELRETNVQAQKLANALVSAGRGEDGVTLLQDWLARYPDDALTRSYLASHYLGQAKLHEAEIEFAKLVELNPDDVVARNNLAWLLLQSGKTEAALVHAERAHALQREDPQILDTLGRILLEQGTDDERALMLLTSAAEALPDDRAINANLARALARTGQSDRARQILERILADDEPFPNRAEAEELLGNLKR